MESVLSALTLVPFAAAVAEALRSRAKMRVYRARIDDVLAREDALLRAVRAFVDASRISSLRVIELLDRAVRVCEPSVDVVLAFVPSGDELACIYASGERAAHYRQIRLRRDAGDSLPSQAATCGHRVSGAKGALIPLDRHALAVPMLDGEGLRAVIYVASCKIEAMRREDDLVRTIEYAASPFGLALAREADRVDATYDGLTGLLTARAFRLRLAEEIDRARARPGAAFTLWFIDTDHFKSVNDMHGHAAGDRALQTMAEIIRAHATPELDFAGRNGGDEFCVLVAGQQKSLAIERAQDLCDAVRAREFGLAPRLTASIGVASYPYDARSANELLEVADAAMYHSKRAGRDCVSFSSNGTAFSTFARRVENRRE